MIKARGTLVQSGYCNFCGVETGDKYYIFCDSKCRDFWLTEKGGQMGQWDIDRELYIKWFEEKTLVIEKMTKEDLEKRIREIYFIEFYCKREWAMLHQHWDKVVGRKGIPRHLQEEREKLITDPNIQVDWGGEPRKKEKKDTSEKTERKNMFKDIVKELTQNILKENKGFVEPEKVEKKQTLAEALNSMSLVQAEPEKPKASAEEIKSKADAVKEKMRLAKEKLAKEKQEKEDKESKE